MAETAGSRDRIVVAAMTLFASNGYEKTALLDIAREAGVKPGSVYYFFATKASILSAVLERYLEGLQPVILAPAFARTNDPVERVFEILADYRSRLVGTDFAYRCPIGSLALEIGPSEPAIRELIERNFAAWRAAVSACFAAAARGFGPGFDPDALACLVLTIMEGALMQSSAQRSIEPFDLSVRQLRAYLECLRRRSGARSKK